MKKYPGLHYSVLQKALREKNITLNGKVLTDDIALLEGDVVTISIPDSQLFSKPELDIVYEDDHVLMVNKPLNIASQGDNSLEKDAALYCEAPVFCCFPLDAAIGGVVLFAKSKQANNDILRAIKSNEIYRIYHCLVKGHPEKETGELKGYAVKQSRFVTKIYPTNTKGGSLVHLSYQLIQYQDDDDYSLLEVDQIEGSLSLLRFQLASSGCPVMGDDKYGDRGFNRRHQAGQKALWSVGFRFHLGHHNRLKYLNTINVITKNYVFDYQ